MRGDRVAHSFLFSKKKKSTVHVCSFRERCQSGSTQLCATVFGLVAFFCIVLSFFLSFFVFVVGVGCWRCAVVRTSFRFFFLKSQSSTGTDASWSSIMQAMQDFFTSLAHAVYFGPQTPSSSHYKSSDTAEALHLLPVSGGSAHPQAVEEQPRTGSSDRWKLFRCLVSHANEQRPSQACLRVVSISDTHMKHKFLRNRVPNGDVLVHCGDILMTSVRYSDMENLRRVRKFNQWLGTLPHEHKIVIAGNHDGFLQRQGVEGAQELLSNATYLCDSGINIRGVKFWGTPVSWGHSRNDAFQDDQDETHIRKIPADTDILLTHGFPFERLRNFRKQLRHVKPAVHICGHWHAGAGVHFWNRSLVTVNCSMLNGKYRLQHLPTVLDIPAALPPPAGSGGGAGKEAESDRAPAEPVVAISAL